ncbi:hypothetical protein C5N14_16465 [Micromonospora sp. MW-13]|uniref:hypothetical protein n=1 Tax=unclassified Micromonospora TaxID=2617518 RepID=UPI000EED6164|nr:MULTISPECIES: hypothetical protein [unclassified Micromonospora]MCX4470876.1 hypothetical protein [Micromonospora sp. NBC_01655]RGC67801.1 hypothetical protein C5N14_16465 [Micromonospora sp. MW-13]
MRRGDLRAESQCRQLNPHHEEPDMFGNDAGFLLSIHRAHAAELRADADADRLARSVPRRHGRDWLGRRRHSHHSHHTGDTRR